MPTPIVESEELVTSIKEFVRRLSRKGAVDIENLLLHLLDTAKNHWNDKATNYLRELNDFDLSTEEAKDVKEKYDKAFNNVHRVLRMRHGVSISKRTY